MKTKFLIFGVTGDLAARKLMPAMTRILESRTIEDIEIIGVSRHQFDIGSIVGKTLASRSRSFTMDVSKAEDYLRLKEFINLAENEQLVVYLSVPPNASTIIADMMGEAGLNSSNVKILFEKPFGLDLNSAETMVERTSRYFKEDQIYRIDHYLAKGMAQNIVAFRSSNAIFRQVWSNRAIESIEVKALEKIGIEGRVVFYEQTGAMRDVLQGHLLQLLALVLMDIPADFDWKDLPDLRLQALKRIMPADPAKTVRAQYEGYRDEAGIPASEVETFVNVELASNSSVWEGVPLIMTTGKATDRKLTEIKVHFKASSVEQTNCLRFKLQPEESVEIDLYAKKPGYDREFEMHKLDFAYQEDSKLPEAYEQVIVDAVMSRKSLFTGSQEIIESWRILQPLLDCWHMGHAPLLTYPKGSSIQDIIGQAN